MKPEPEPLYGQCKCGAALTVLHLRDHCPLRPQQVSLASMSEAQAKELRALVQNAFDSKYDTTHVAVLGEN